MPRQTRPFKNCLICSIKNQERFENMRRREELPKWVGLKDIIADTMAPDTIGYLFDEHGTMSTVNLDACEEPIPYRNWGDQDE